MSRRCTTVFIYKKIHRSRNKVGPKIPLSFIAGRKSAWSRDKMGKILENQRLETYLDPCNLDKIRLHQHSFPWYCGCAHCRGLRPHAQETTFSNPNRVCSRNSTFGAQRLPHPLQADYTTTLMHLLILFKPSNGAHQHHRLFRCLPVRWCVTYVFTVRRFTRLIRGSVHTQFVLGSPRSSNSSWPLPLPNPSHPSRPHQNYISVSI